MSAPSLTLVAAGEGRYLLTAGQGGILFDVDRLRRERQELHCELTVRCDLPGARTIDGRLSAGTFNLSSPRARAERAKQIAERARTGNGVDWLGLLEETSYLVLAAERTGAPAINLATLEPLKPEPEHDVCGFRFPRTHASILFGDGGTGKSIFALYLAGVLVTWGERVMFFDWELDEHTHRDRLELLFGAEGPLPAVKYVRCSRPLVYEVDRLRRIVHAERATFAIFDSAGFGTEGPPEAAEGALAYFRAVRLLGLGSLHTAHVSKAEQADQRPFGSSFWHNSARSTWNIKLATVSPDGSRTQVGLYNRKANLGPLHRAVGLELVFTKDRILIEPVAVADVAELAESLPLWQRMQHVVRRGPMTAAALANELDAKVDTVDRTVRRFSRVFTRVSGADGVTKIALAERRSA